VNHNLQGEAIMNLNICTCAKKIQKKKKKEELFSEGFNGHSQEGKRMLK
jgi:hypothetical protein